MLCGPSALCAITGMRPDQVVLAICKAIRERGAEPPDQLDSTDNGDLGRALELLGFELFNEGGGPVSGRTIFPAGSSLPIYRNAKLWLSFWLKTTNLTFCSDLRRTSRGRPPTSSQQRAPTFLTTTREIELSPETLPPQLATFRVFGAFAVRDSRGQAGNALTAVGP
jgi:hypothetical protein